MLLQCQLPQGGSISDFLPESWLQFGTMSSSKLSWLYSSEQYSVNLLRTSYYSVRHFPDLFWIVEDLPCLSEVDPSPADMFSCCCFCSGKFKSPRTEHLSRPPLLPPLSSETSYLLSCIILLLLPHIASFLNLFYRHRGREHLWWPLRPFAWISLTERNN